MIYSKCVCGYLQRLGHFLHEEAATVSKPTVTLCILWKFAITSIVFSNTLIKCTMFTHIYCKQFMSAK